MPPRRLTDEQVLELYERYRSTGATLAQLAAEAGVSIGMLQGEFMRLDLPRKRTSPYPRPARTLPTPRASAPLLDDEGDQE